MSVGKTLSANELRHITNLSRRQYKKIPWHTAEILVRDTLGLRDYLNTVNSILKDCQSDDGTYKYELIDFATRANVVAAYALIEMPKSPEEMYFLLYGSDLYELITSVVNRAQLQSIYDAVSFSLEYGGGAK